MRNEATNYLSITKNSELRIDPSTFMSSEYIEIANILELTEREDSWLLYQGAEEERR